MHKSKIVKIVVLGIILGSLPVILSFAQNKNPIDTNADGVLSIEEQMLYREKIVKDINGDGKISWEEELPFWKIRYEFDAWKGKECPVRENFALKGSDLPEWIADDIDNEIAWFNDKDNEYLTFRLEFYNFDSGIEAQEYLLRSMANTPAEVPLLWERINIGNASFQFVERGAISIYVLQDNIVVRIVYMDSSLIKSTRETTIKEHLPKAQDIARKIESLIRETPLRKK